MEYANHLKEYASAMSEAQVAEEVDRIRKAAAIFSLTSSNILTLISDCLLVRSFFMFICADAKVFFELALT